ncbi:hypothetical protein [Clostridium sp.]|uniref:hypothetical protein n=1 Tax=Clostridium sp. TaxID=1506 RepID=UPI0032169AE4
MQDIIKDYMHEYFYTNDDEYIRALEEVKKFEDKYKKYNVLTYHDEIKKIVRVSVMIREKEVL